MRYIDFRCASISGTNLGRSVIDSFELGALYQTCMVILVTPSQVAQLTRGVGNLTRSPVSLVTLEDDVKRVWKMMENGR